MQTCVDPKKLASHESSQTSSVPTVVFPMQIWFIAWLSLIHLSHHFLPLEEQQDARIHAYWVSMFRCNGVIYRTCNYRSAVPHIAKSAFWTFVVDDYERHVDISHLWLPSYQSGWPVTFIIRSDVYLGMAVMAFYQRNERSPLWVPGCRAWWTAAAYVRCVGSGRMSKFSPHLRPSRNLKRRCGEGGQPHGPGGPVAQDGLHIQFELLESTDSRRCAGIYLHQLRTRRPCVAW